ncbi:hypothetical protein LQZ18_00415 [Lachnospiraceae bacterium ZAX-1]
MFYHTYFWAPPFETRDPSLFHGNALAAHIKSVAFWAGGVVVSIVADLGQVAFVLTVQGDGDFGEMEPVFQKTISFNGIKGRVPQKSRMLEEVEQEGIMG